jgi:hypothetical protein
LNDVTDQTITTNATGNYSGNVAGGTTVQVVPSKMGAFGSGVSALDASRILQAVAGLITFTPLQRLACDVTGDGSLSTVDAQRILQYSAGLINRFPVALNCGSDWVFYPSPDPLNNQQVVPPTIGSGNCRAGNIVLSPLLTPAANQNFQGILFGDCTGNWTPTTGALHQVAPSGMTVQTGAPRHAPGHELLIPVYVHAHTPFTALDLQVVYDPDVLTLTSVVPRGSAAGAMTGINNEEPGQMGVSLASASPIDPSLGVMLILEFHSTGTVGRNAVRLVQAQVDEQTTAVTTHPAR